jgi:hypothetical protein
VPPVLRRHRVATAIAIGLAAAGGSFILYRQARHPQSDWDAAWYGARAWLVGLEPYAAARSADLGYTLLYPGPALLTVLPLALLPLDVARSLFVGIGAGGMAYAVTGRGWWGLLAFSALPVIVALLVAQWGPVLLLGATVPALGFLFACKPTIGAALWIRGPTRLAVLGGMAVLLASWAIDPEWPVKWHAETRTAPWIMPLVTRPYGWLLLLAWLRWRDPDARLLGAFAVVPFTMAPSETVACFLIPRTWREMALLVTCAQAAFLLAMLLGWPDDHATRNALHWPAWLGLFYLPALAVVLLRRPPAAVQAPSRPAAASSAI